MNHIICISVYSLDKLNIKADITYFFASHFFQNVRQSFYDKWRVKLLCTNIYSTLYQISLLYSLTWKTKIKINCRQLFSNFIINVGTPFMKISFLELIFISKFMIFVVNRNNFQEIWFWIIRFYYWSKAVRYWLSNYIFYLWHIGH